MFSFFLRFTCVIFARAINTDVWQTIVTRATKSWKTCSKPPYPYAKRTALDWRIIAKTAPDATGNDDGVKVNRIVLCEAQFSPRKICHFALNTHAREFLIRAQVKHLFQLDFNEPRLADQALSHEERIFMSKVSKSIHPRCDGHYEMPLPFKQESVALPDIKEVVLHRLSGKLKRRLKTDSKYLGLPEFMSNLIQCGHSERVPTEDVVMKNGHGLPFEETR